jgi:hypothetical protein
VAHICCRMGVVVLSSFHAFSLLFIPLLIRGKPLLSRSVLCQMSMPCKCQIQCQFQTSVKEPNPFMSTKSNA